jgi:hypothetical protein
VTKASMAFLVRTPVDTFTTTLRRADLLEYRRVAG